MSKKRVFVAINLPDDVKSQLAALIEKIQPKFDPGTRFISRDNWHLTLTFLGYQTDDEIGRISRAVGETAASFVPPAVGFEKVLYGPAGRTPRMIWLVGNRETSDGLALVKSDLDKRLFEAGIRFEVEHRQYNAHLTLARFPARSREHLPPLEIPFVHQFQPATLDLMESHLKRSGADYEPLAKFDFEGVSE